MSQWIEREVERPPQEWVESLRDIPTGILGDCMNRAQTMDAGLATLVPGGRICGPALTVQSVESCNWGAHQMLSIAKPGDVLVLAARGGMSAGVWGHVLTTAALKIGLAGVVIDGCIRDAAENRADKLPIFCRGVCPGGPHKGWPCNLNVPVSCAGVAVMPGDIVVADDDGVAVVPKNRAATVLEEARRRIELEASWYHRMEAGDSTLKLLGLEPI